MAPAKNKKLLFLLLKIGVAAVLLFLLVQSIEWREIVYVLKNPKTPSMLIFAGVLLLPNILLQNLRWHYLLRLHRPGISQTESFRSLLGGMVTGFITPGRIGEMGRSLFLRKEEQWEAVGLVFVDKLYAFIIILLAGVWSMVFFLISRFTVSPYLIWPLCVIALLITMVGGVLALHPQWIRNAVYQLSMILPVRERSKGLVQVLDRFTRQKAVPFLWLTLLMYVIYAFQFCLFMRAFDPIPWHQVLIVVSATLFTKTLFPVALADLGIREGAAVFFLKQMGRDPVAAFNGSLLVFFINIVIPTLAGLIFLPRLGAGIAKDNDHQKNPECMHEISGNSPSGQI